LRSRSGRDRREAEGLAIPGYREAVAVLDQDQEPQLHPGRGTRGVIRSSAKDRALQARTRARAGSVPGAVGAEESGALMPTPECCTFSLAHQALTSGFGLETEHRECDRCGRIYERRIADWKPIAFRCPKCGRLSYDRKNVEQAYCKECKGSTTR